MRTRTLALALSLGVLAVTGCKSTKPAEQPAFLASPPPGARVISSAPPETAQPPVASPLPSRLPN